MESAARTELVRPKLKRPRLYFWCFPMACLGFLLTIMIFTIFIGLPLLIMNVTLVTSCEKYRKTGTWRKSTRYVMLFQAVLLGAFLAATYQEFFSTAFDDITPTVVFLGCVAWILWLVVLTKPFFSGEPDRLA